VKTCKPYLRNNQRACKVEKKKVHFAYTSVQTCRFICNNK